MYPALESLHVREEPVKLMKPISALSWHPQAGLPWYQLYPVSPGPAGSCQGLIGLRVKADLGLAHWIQQFLRHLPPPWIPALQAAPSISHGVSGRQKQEDRTMLWQLPPVLHTAGIGRQGGAPHRAAVTALGIPRAQEGRGRERRGEGRTAFPGLALIVNRTAGRHRQDALRALEKAVPWRQVLGRLQRSTLSGRLA